MIRYVLNNAVQDYESLDNVTYGTCICRREITMPSLRFSVHSPSREN